ncbi:pilus assembly protein [Stieleria sp. TO1_6]|uniref:TadE/TadG family type IV pilus assembly protein n=1 Tax=Stieleria tagensis TaxID=2956795 RepID=UPI00209B808A|nr:TadE family protein [Stieleria tagensis]MCO8122778.1 pilus assembly protein [Stieleria tagensis]
MQRINKRNRRTTDRRLKRGDGLARRGAAAVEFAICANVFFVLIFTCMEFARMNMIRNLAQDAAYFAARHAMVPGATEDEAVAVADDVMGMVVSNGYQVEVGELGDDIPEVEVTITVNFDEIALFAPMFLPNATIQSVARMRTERYDGYYQQ